MWVGVGYPAYGITKILPSDIMGSLSRALWDLCIRQIIPQRRPWFPTADIQAMFSSLLAINDLWRTFLAQRAWEILGVTVSSFILLHFIFRPARRGLPPMVSYWIPWVGSAITMAKDPVESFKRAS